MQVLGTQRDMELGPALKEHCPLKTSLLHALGYAQGSPLEGSSLALGLGLGQ